MKKFLKDCFTQNDNQTFSYCKAFIVTPLLSTICYKMESSTIAFTGIDIFWICLGLSIATFARDLADNGLLEKIVGAKK